MSSKENDELPERYPNSKSMTQVLIIKPTPTGFIGSKSAHQIQTAIPDQSIILHRMFCFQYFIVPNICL